MWRIKFLLCVIVMVGGLACKEIYKPTIISSDNYYLVVEGVLNASADSTIIRLSRSFKLDDSASIQRERNAQVVVEGKDNTTRNLIMTGDGVYTSPNLNLVINNEYRLRIITASGKEYLSDYVVAKKTPVIDSVGFRQNEEGVQLYVNAHDDANATRYYRWEYDETWEIRTYYNTNLKYENDSIKERDPSENVSVCWKYGGFNSILLGSTASLQSDIIFRAPLTFINRGHEKITVRYSILVRQYALDKAAYDFYEMMKKNTEGLGSVFDPQPSEVRGNIFSVTDPGEPVIGYVSASTVERQRYFIDRSQVGVWHFYQDCPETRIRNNPDSIRDAFYGGGSAYQEVRNMAGSVTHYLFAPRPCVECPARGGSLIRPSYW